MKAIVLAAGYAMRLYPLTKDRPKALLPIGGRPMLDYLFDGIDSIPEIDEAIIVSNHRFAAQFDEWSEKRAPGRVRVTVLDDMTSDNESRLGAIGDISFAIREKRIDEDVLIAASDNFFTFPLNDFAADFRAHGRDTLLAGEIDDVSQLRRFAVAVCDADKRVTALVEKPRTPPSRLAVYALYIYRRDTLPLIDKYLAEGNNPDSPGHFPEWLYTRRDVRLYTFTGECVDIGTPESYARVCAEYSQAL